jgi:hypothetical protein
MFFAIVGTQLATAHMNTNVVRAKVSIWPNLLCIGSCYCDGDCTNNIASFGECESACEFGTSCARGGWITAFIRLPKEYDAKDIDPLTVTLQVMGGSVPVSKYNVFWRAVFIARFDRAAVVDLLCSMLGHMAPNMKQKVTLVVTGNLLDGKSFRGEDTIRVFFLD